MLTQRESDAAKMLRGIRPAMADARFRTWQKLVHSHVSYFCQESDTFDPRDFITLVMLRGSY